MNSLALKFHQDAPGCVQFTFEQYGLQLFPFDDEFGVSLGNNEPEEF